ncbi:MAG: peptide ABC transporter permease [Hyphomicrobium sp.]|uniref:peptide ABC transporter permease n=1 Tax=Hyphomicrobium sp. TaxID=82 RepID=UPI0013235A38|nr:peptide ABC transporter permease [Hyphomicrobium sp.]KAB2939926.1 MAG: peptide ABC transporter permease [Hyphomicrobium sp.]MBZ0209855.1 peptide ABC transporter permease [Hyphomicrobium sp.]
MTPAGRRDLQNYPADKARQGDIILKTRTQRAIFIGGLAGLALLALLGVFMR